MYLEPVSQPIYMGPLNFRLEKLDSVQIDSLRDVFGKYIHVKEDESYVESNHVDVSAGGEEFTKDNLNAIIKSALQNYPQNFIADGQTSVQVEFGSQTEDLTHPSHVVLPREQATDRFQSGNPAVQPCGETAPF